jgi:hypothetical protein
VAGDERGARRRSSAGCLVLEGAPTTTTVLELPMTLVGIELGEPEYGVHEQ